MKKFALIALPAAFALAACGDSTDASDDAVADTVEVPADDAMANVPDPVIDEAVTENVTPAEAEERMNVTEEQAEEAADAAESAVDDALSAAEAAQNVQAEAE